MKIRVDSKSVRVSNEHTLIVAHSSLLATVRRRSNLVTSLVVWSRCTGQQTALEGQGSWFLLREAGQACDGCDLAVVEAEAGKEVLGVGQCEGEGAGRKRVVGTHGGVVRELVHRWKY